MRGMRNEIGQKRLTHFFGCGQEGRLSVNGQEVDEGGVDKQEEETGAGGVTGCIF